MLLFLSFFCCKQKTVYELRISDWSSEVCSSDLFPSGQAHERRLPSPRRADRPDHRSRRAGQAGGPRARFPLRPVPRAQGHRPRDPGEAGHRADRALGLRQVHPAARIQPYLRSEEHTSELQSLMRISYAVFCLKKKIKKKTEI